MALLESHIQGIIDIYIVQGNYQEVTMQFMGDGNPIDLTSFADIRMEIKTRFDVNLAPFVVFTVGDGLTISGDDNNILTFILGDIFYSSQICKFVYDIVFETPNGERYTYIKGTIKNNLTASKT